MKIVHIVNDATLGGAQTFIVQLARAARGSHELHLVVLLGEGPLSAQYEDAFASVLYLETRSASPIKAAWRFRKHLSALRPDIAHSHLLQSDLVNVLLSPRWIRRFSTVHTTGMSKADPLASRIVGRLVGKLSHGFAGVVACNAACSDYMTAAKYRGDRKVIPNGILIPPAIRYNPSRYVMTSLARLHPMKDHATLLRAFARASQPPARDWVLRCFGEGVTSDAPALQEALADNDVKEAVERGAIELNGPTLNPLKELEHSAALVISSSYGEAAPMVAIEAASIGIPIISTRVGGATDLVQDELLKAQPQDVESLRLAIERFFFLTDSAKLTLANQTRNHAIQAFNIESTNRAYLEYYDEAERGN